MAEWEKAPLEEQPEPDWLSAFSRGALGSGVEGVGMATGAIAGAPFGPAGILLGGAGGYLAGNLARKGLSKVQGPLSGKPLTYERTEDLPPQDRPAGVAGEVVGGGVPFSMVPYRMAGTKPATTIVGKIAQKIGQTAQDFPKSFAATEAAGLGGAATGGAAMQYLYPDDHLARVAGETAGGVFTPGRVAGTAARVGMTGLRRAWTALSPEGRKDEASRIVQSVIAQAGEDPDAIAAALRNAPLPEIRGTSAQRSGSTGLTMLENTLAKESEKFGDEAALQAKQSLQMLRQNIEILTASGHPAALRAAAQERARYFDMLLEGRVSKAEREATEAAGKIGSGVTRAQASVKMRDSLENAMRASRTEEKSLWSKVDMNLPGGADNVLAAHAELRAGMLPEERLPGIVEGRIAAYTKGEKPTTGQLILLRSRMLELARESADKNEWRDANAYGRIAEAALDDLDAIFKAGGNAAYDEARAFSKSMHDVFTRTFAGTALDTGPHGRARIPPELLASRAFGGGKEGGTLRFEQLHEATKFMPSLGKGGEQAEATMLAAQDHFLRAAASELVDPRTGRVDPGRLAKFRRDNAEMIGQFPETMKIFANAQRAEETLANVTGNVKQAQRAINRDAAFVRLAGAENPTDAIAMALKSNRPWQSLTQYARLARDDGKPAMDGLRSALIGWAFDRSIGPTGEFSWLKFRQTLMSPMGSHQPSIFGFMMREKLVSKEEAESLRLFVTEAEKRIKNLGDPRKVQDLLSETDAFTDLMLRVTGANIGGHGAVSGAAGTPLVAAHAGSKTMRRLFDKIPVARTRDLLIEASLDPNMMRALLARPVTERQRLGIGRQMNAFLWEAAIHEPISEAIQ